MPEALVLMGVIGRPHGVRGLAHVRSYTADPADLPGYGPFSDGAGRRFTLRWAADGIAAIAELVDGGARPVADRTSAERLVNTRLYVERARLPATDEDEFYLADLVGLEAVDPAGAALGQVAAVHDYGAGASLEIGTLLIPFTRACVPMVDLAAGRLVRLHLDAGDNAYPLHFVHKLTAPPGPASRWLAARIEAALAAA